MITFNDLIHRQKRLLPINDPDIFFPAYDGYSLANIPGSICQWLGIPNFGEPALDSSYPLSGQKFDRVIMIVMDGLGWLRLQNWMAHDTSGDLSIWKELDAQNHLLPLTSISPSTTCAALTTLNTGKFPIAHGNIAYELWLKEYGAVYNMILQAPMTNRGGIDHQTKNTLTPSTFLPVETLDMHMMLNGCSMDTLHPASIARSNLSAMLFPKARQHGYYTMGDMFYRLERMSQIIKDKPAYIYAYWSDIDELSHIYGPDDARVRLALRDFSRYLRDFRDRLATGFPGRTNLIVTADHGLQSTPLNDEYNLSRHQRLLDQLVMRPTGENRLPFLHCKNGKEEAVREYIDQIWPGKFLLFRTKEVLSSGLLGTSDCFVEAPSRMGDLVAISRENTYWWWSTKENRLTGRHGGLSLHEMLVPLAMMSF